MATTHASASQRVPVWLIPLLWTLAFGTWGLSRQDSVWRDEAATWNVAQRSTAEIWHLLGNVDVVHGCYYLLMHVLFEWFGPGTSTLRLPSVVAAAAAASCVAAIGGRLAGTWAGLAGGLAFSMLPAVQFYLQEGRPYALVAAGVGASTLLLVHMLQDGAGVMLWAAYGSIVVICGLLNWLSLMVLLAHLMTLLWVRAGRKVWARWAAASALATACTAPLILFSSHQSAQVSWIPPLTWHMVIGPAVLLAIGGIAAVLDHPRIGRLSLASVGMPLLAVPQIGLMGLSLIQPLFLDRYILYSMLGLALLIGGLISLAIRAVRPRFPRTAPWILPLVVALAMVVLLPQSLAKRSPKSRVDDVVAIAADMQRMNQKGAAVVFVPSARRDTKTVSPEVFTGLHDIALMESPERSGTLKGIESRPRAIRTAMLASRRIVLVTDAPGVARPVTAERDKMKMRVLRKYFEPIADKQDRGRRVTVYERRNSTLTTG